MDLTELKQKVIPVLRKHNIKRAGIFGSYATGSVNQESDLDILVEPGEKISLLEFVGIKLELEEILNLKIDLVEYEGIKPALKERILKEQVQIL